jgi:hypothetical protein
MKGAGKHKRDRKNLTTDEPQKPVFENHFTSDKTCFAGNETLFKRNDVHLRKDIAKSSGEAVSIWFAAFL